MTPTQLQEFLNHQIPLTKSLEVKVLTASDEVVELFAPLAPNHNHMGSAFGGSLSALLILGGYTWLYHYLQSRGHTVHVILKSSQTDFADPVEQDIHVQAKSPATAEVEKFMESFTRKGLGRLFMDSSIGNDSGIMASMRGEFVVKRVSKG